MKKIISFVLLATSFTGFSQIKFEESQWEDALRRAKKENKILFLEAYASWSEPCQLLEKYTFSDLEVANFYNENFINFRMNMETYPGIGLAEQLSVSIYPTLIFLDSNGGILHRGCGAMDANELLALGKEARGDDHLKANQRKFEEGERSAPFILKYLSLMEAGCMNVNTFARKLLTNTNLEDLTRENSFVILEEYQWDIYSREFQHLIINQELFAKSVGSERVQAKIFNTFLSQYQEIYASEELHHFGMRALLQQLESTTFQGSDTLTTMSRLHYSEFIEDWEAFAKYAIQWVDMSGVNDPEEINELAWKFYLFIDDEDQLKIALNWVKESVDESPSPSSIDTYASLIFKLGDKKKAIELEKQAITMAIQLMEELDHYEYQLKTFQGND